MTPSFRNCCNYGNSEKSKWILVVAIVAIMAILKHAQFMVTSIVAITAILKIILLTPYAHNCCNYGTFEKSKWILVVAIVAIMAILKKKKKGTVHGDSNYCYYDNYGNNIVDSWSSQLLQLWQFWKKKKKPS